MTLGNRKYQKENPILQNRGHITAIRAILGHDIPMYNFVVFGGRADLRISDVTDAVVIHTRRLVELIKSIPDEEFTEVQIHAIHQQLMLANITDASTRKQHVDSIKRRYK